MRLFFITKDIELSWDSELETKITF